MMLGWSSSPFNVHFLEGLMKRPNRVRMLSVGLAALPFAVALALSACGGDSASGVASVQEAARGFTSQPVSLSLTKIGGFQHSGGLSSAEITAYDAGSKRLFVVNGALGSVDVLDLSDPSTPILIDTIPASGFGAGLGGINGVAVHQGVVALAIEASPKTDPGIVAWVRAKDLAKLGTDTVGALPDMITFTSNGRYLLVANEGEPSSYGQADSVDPEGSISIIRVQGLSPNASSLRREVRTADFSAFNSRLDELRAAGLRLFGPGATVAQDLEPEYIAISDDNRFAWVTLQENNAIAIVDIERARVTDIRPLGYKDHSLPGMGMDVSNEDGGTNTNSGTSVINIAPVPVKGMYMPDAIAAYRVKGRNYLVTANEGDAREYTGLPGGREDPRVRDYCGVSGFDTAVFGAAASNLGNDSNLGRLRITMFPGGERTGKNEAGQCNELVSFGARSFSIWDAGTMTRVYDSGDEFEQRTKALPNVKFNTSNDNDTQDDRSPAKGPEPEGVVLGQFGGRTFAFVGLERVGGVMVYDVTDPANASFVTYLNTRDGNTGDRGPEGLTLIDAASSPNGKPLLIVGNETSGTTAIVQIDVGLGAAD
jgi:DNA-binding beta-propeller fold protein YncE